MKIIGIFGMIAFFGFLGPFSSVIAVGNILLVMIPRYFFSVFLEKQFQARGFKTDINDVILFSLLGFLIQLFLVAAYFNV